MKILATVLSATAALIVLSGCAYDRSDRYGYGCDGYGYSGYHRNCGRNHDGWTATLTGTASGIATSHIS